jgi:hypothetical protein
MDYIRRFATENRPEILALIEKYPQVKVITLTSRAEADAYLNTIKTGDETL